MKENNYLKKALMWYKVKELWSTGLNKSQIAREVGVHRKTVRSYLNMDEQQFHLWMKKRKHIPPKLQPYYEFVQDQLKRHPFLSAAQIEDRLKEHFADLPMVHSKTVYNFVQTIRSQQNIPKPKTDSQRLYQKLAEVDYGLEAQVDFGVYNMVRGDGGRQKVWFFAMVLSRSRQKYVYLQASPFTSSTSIYAHQLAFEYFQGVPKKVLYDQDRVFVVNENMGDVLLTQDFQRYVESESFEAVFCRKADPESKGKVENVVKYVKYNFLRGREFSSIQQLNESVLSWLERTGNGKRHATTRLVPHQEWEQEKKYLLPIKTKPHLLDTPEYKEYHVLKDHTISYRGNFYSLPLGSYQGKNSRMLVQEADGQLHIYDMDHHLVTTHTLCILKGRYIRHTDHSRDKSSSMKENLELCVKRLGNTVKAKAFVAEIKRSKSRYLNDNLRLILSKLKGKEQQAIEQALDYCMEHGYYNALKMVELVSYFERKQDSLPNLNITIPSLPEKALTVPKTSNINTYETLFN